MLQTTSLPPAGGATEKSAPSSNSRPNCRCGATRLPNRGPIAPLWCLVCHCEAIHRLAGGDSATYRDAITHDPALEGALPND